MVRFDKLQFPKPRIVPTRSSAYTRPKAVSRCATFISLTLGSAKLNTKAMVSMRWSLSHKRHGSGWFGVKCSYATLALRRILMLLRLMSWLMLRLNESGRPSYLGSWVDQDTWLTGRFFFHFVSEVCIPKFILISVHDYYPPSFLLSKVYFTRKRKAESEMLSSGQGSYMGKRKVDGFEIPLDLIEEPIEQFLNAIENFTKPLNSLPASDLLLAPLVSVDDDKCCN
ncbi:hypothetical protein Pfo_025847 [Paulownia fortunei]|nr:hypothetical protein Pfo_025847 [Paulownia fortunei]